MPTIIAPKVLVSYCMYVACATSRLQRHSIFLVVALLLLKASEKCSFPKSLGAGSADSAVSVVLAILKIRQSSLQK